MAAKFWKEKKLAKEIKARRGMKKVRRGHVRTESNASTWVPGPTGLRFCLNLEILKTWREFVLAAEQTDPNAAA